MPSSQYYHISKIMEIIISLDPKSVLDMGSGFGKFGVLCREYLELWDGRQKYEFKRRIDCVEVFQQYISPLHQYIYDNVYNNDILDIAPKLDIRYDLILLIDVLEHFEKDDGIKLLKTLLANNECILISTPKKPTPQKDAFGNVYETHRSAWSLTELSSLGNIAFVRDDISWISIISSNSNVISNYSEGIKRLKSHGKLPIETKLKRFARQVPGVANTYRKLKVNRK
ncbi:MAG TPA: methyltransferase domain-containing protein [Candidatus Nitrosocosmicus sp.]|nr:methyltransferase domain-containing protein [Candidatus Nitrosocosmicus sp.]